MEAVVDVTPLTSFALQFLDLFLGAPKFGSTPKQDFGVRFCLALRRAGAENKNHRFRSDEAENIPFLSKTNQSVNRCVSAELSDDE